MEKNFHVGQSNELVKDGQVYDLHNLYDFVGLVLKDRDNLRLSFEPNKRHGAGQIPVLLEFEAIDYLEFRTDCGTTEFLYLDEIGYKSPGDQDDAWLLSEQQASSNDHLFFRLGGEAFIRVHSQRAHLLGGVIAQGCDHA